MPPPYQVGAQVAIHGLLHGQQTVNVLHFGGNIPWNVDTINADLQALAQAVMECVVQTLLPAVTSDWTFTKVVARAIEPQPSDEAIAVSQAGNVGQLGACSHSFAASLISIGTGGGGRSGRGRIFLPPPGEPQVANSTIDGPTLILIVAFLTCMREKFVNAGHSQPWELGVYSRKNAGGVLGTFNNSFRPATALIAQPDCAVMSSRRRGRGV